MPSSETLLLLAAAIAVLGPLAWAVAWLRGTPAVGAPNSSTGRGYTIALEGSLVSDLGERLALEPVWREARRRLRVEIDPLAERRVTAVRRLGGHVRLRADWAHDSEIPGLSEIEIAPGPALAPATSAVLLLSLARESRHEDADALADCLRRAAERIEAVGGERGLPLSLRRLVVSCRAEAALIQTDASGLDGAAADLRGLLRAVHDDVPERDRALIDLQLARVCLRRGITDDDSIRLGEGLAVAATAEARLRSMGGDELAARAARLIARIRLALHDADGDPAHLSASRSALAAAMAAHAIPSDQVLSGAIAQAWSDVTGDVGELVKAANAFRRALRAETGGVDCGAAAAGLAEVLVASAIRRHRPEDREEGMAIATAWLAGEHDPIDDATRSRLHAALASARVDAAEAGNDADLADTALSDLRRARRAPSTGSKRIQQSLDDIEARALIAIGRSRPDMGSLRAGVDGLRTAMTGVTGARLMRTALKFGEAQAVLARHTQNTIPLDDALQVLDRAILSTAVHGASSDGADAEMGRASLLRLKASIDPDRPARHLDAAAAALRQALAHLSQLPDDGRAAACQVELGEVLLELGLSGAGTPRIEQASALFRQVLSVAEDRRRWALAERATEGLATSEAAARRLQPAASPPRLPHALASRGLAI